MNYYNRLDQSEKLLLENYSSRLNSNSAQNLFTPQTSQRTFNSQRLPLLHSFSSILDKPQDTEIVPKPSSSQTAQKTPEKATKPKAKLRKRSAAPRLNGRFYTEKGLNSKHPGLAAQVKKIFSLVERHNLKCHQDLKQVDFSALKKHFFR